jgi:hypothetical protein
LPPPPPPPFKRITFIERANNEKQKQIPEFKIIMQAESGDKWEALWRAGQQDRGTISFYTRNFPTNLFPQK